MTNSTSILSLVSAIKRAKFNRQTDDDQAIAEVMKKFGHEVINVAGKFNTAEGGPLEGSQILETLAAVLGTMILTSTDPGPNRHLATMILAGMVISSATQEEDPK